MGFSEIGDVITERGNHRWGRRPGLALRYYTFYYLLMKLGKILAGKKSRDDAERNRRRLEEAALVSRELGVQRIADEEIKKLVFGLVYEAGAYITAARESEGAFYDPLVIDALETARAAVNVWKKNENEAAELKYLRVDGKPGGIVIPRESIPEEFVPGEEGSVQSRGEIRGRTLGILRESLRLFLVQNSIRAAGDPEAALVALAAIDPVEKGE